MLLVYDVSINNPERPPDLSHKKLQNSIEMYVLSSAQRPYAISPTCLEKAWTILFGLNYNSITLAKYDM